MSLIRDEDRCCCIIGILPIVYSLAFCYHRFVLVLHFCSHRALHVCVIRCTTSPRRSRWVYVPYMSECLRCPPNVCSRRMSRFLYRVASQPFTARRKQSTSSERLRRHGDVRRRSVEATIGEKLCKAEK